MKMRSGATVVAVTAVLGGAGGLDLEPIMQPQVSWPQVQPRRVADMAPAGLSTPGVPTSIPTNIPTLVPTLVPSPAPSTTPAPTGSDSSERSALEALYKSAGGEGWSTNLHWMDDDKHVSEWYGVTGGGEDADGNYYYDDTSGPLGTVTRVFLEQNSLVGSLPTAVGNCLESRLLFTLKFMTPLRSPN